MSRHRLMYCLTTYSALAALYLLPFSADSIRIGSLRGRAVLAALYGLLAITSLASEEHRTGRKLFDLLKVPLGTFQAAIVLVMCFRLPLWSLQQWPLVILAALSLALLFLTQSTRLETAPPSTASENSVPARLRTATLLMVPMAAAFVVGAQSSAAPVTRRGLNVPDGLLFTFE